MGERNSSLTRVQPVFNALLALALTSEGWLYRLCEMAASTRPGVKPPARVGHLLLSETPERAAREGKVFERIVPPPRMFLRWLLEHPERMDVKDRETFGTTSANARDWRRKLFADSAKERTQAIAEGLRQLDRTSANGSYRKWWAFEGFSHVDCCFVADDLVLFVEGKRTESVAPATLWFKQRSQLWRNVEAAKEFAAGKQFAVILAVEAETDGREALDVATSSLAGSYPHLDDTERRKLDQHLLGYVTWASVVSEFGLPESCLIERVFSV